MATFTSIQSGSWHSATTWDQGAVPNLSVDDVIIAAGHEVTFAAGQSGSQCGNRGFIKSVRVPAPSMYLLDLPCPRFLLQRAKKLSLSL